ncbi:YbaB/EbfC family nucleoid-associated protein [Thermomonospora cellulosilytica]|uniref:DNA-binding protein YbaB n=1 Tax=Thermomonospora cellulosilytica TaxID=1411118 RepID=A0A7W3RCF0_9ACTN|nr:YbaB/EbfC family nucleoid-associated protein [Thermomonospora cellulosilytica]MBA9007245.1 DNA-binding protein YbaB [Thermomonospora cellulosilytica]
MAAGEEGFDREERLREARERLASAGTVTDRAETPAEGEAANGWVRAVAAEGRLIEIVLNPRAMRWGPAELAEHLTSAINTALDGARAEVLAATEPMIDPATLLVRLREVQDASMRVMAAIGQGLDEAIAKIRERASVTGTPASAQGFDILLEQTRALVTAAVPPSAVEDEQDLRGTGRDPSGLVVAVAAPGGRVESLEIGARALRTGSADLADGVMAAVNAALDDLRERESARSGALGSDELLGRVREIQDLNLEQMRVLTRSLSTVMTNIRRD